MEAGVKRGTVGRLASGLRNACVCVCVCVCVRVCIQSGGERDGGMVLRFWMVVRFCSRIARAH